MVSKKPYKQPVPGDKIEVLIKGKTETGTLLEQSDPGILLLKLPNGYNIGLKKEEITELKLIEHIEKKAKHIKELLCTPLMVTLLVLSYKSFKKLPAQLSDFYEELFHTLLQRHDGIKPGFTRQRGCSLDDYQYRLAFESFCIYTKKSGLNSLTPIKTTELAKLSLDHCELGANPSVYIDDIVKIK